MIWLPPSLRLRQSWFTNDCRHYDLSWLQYFQVLVILISARLQLQVCTAYLVRPFVWTPTQPASVIWLQICIMASQSFCCVMTSSAVLRYAKDCTSKSIPGLDMDGCIFQVSWQPTHRNNGTEPKTCARETKKELQSPIVTVIHFVVAYQLCIID